MSLADKIKKIRFREGLSQKRFAEILGYSRGYITDIENERAKPSRGIIEAIISKYNIPLDWLFSDSKILDLIEINRDHRNKDLICLYGFTQDELSCGEQMLKDLLGQRRYVFVDATNKTSHQIREGIIGESKRDWALREKINSVLLHEEIIIIIKNISRSKHPFAAEGGVARTIFKIIDDASPFTEEIPKSILILLDFASYIEKIHEWLGNYIIPIYIGEPRGMERLL